MLVRFRLDCHHKRVTRSKPRLFADNNLQQVGTYIQDAHSSPSIKGKSRSSSKKRFVYNTMDSDAVIDADSNTSTNATSPKKNKVSTCRPINKASACNFNITVICSKSDHKWYLRYRKGNCKCEWSHQGHLPVKNTHVSQRIKHLPKDVDEFIISSINNHVSSSVISNLVLTLYHRTITEVDICHYRDTLSNSLLKEASDLPYGTPVDKLIAEFQLKKDVSFCYVLHDMNSGFVTYKKNKEDASPIPNGRDNDEFISVYQHEVETWRKLLKVGTNNKILVAFAWSHDDELKNAMKFPEFWACDTTFGVTKEQRNLFLMAGIDGNNKVFTIFHCFMPSKEARAYNWALRIAFKNLVGEHALHFNQCIASDAELAMYTPIRGMIESVPCMKKSHHRLDKFHLLNKEWKDNVSTKVTGDNQKKIIANLFAMLGNIFDYVESNEEMIGCMNHFKAYYNKTKKSLKSDNVIEAIDKIVMSVRNQLKYVAHYNFMRISTFGFLGDSIVEAANSGIKSGSIKVATNMKINTSGSTQIKISENQTHKKNR